MEVYRSSRTAEEMEYALGAIPSIGANNHWFIGGQDTGVVAIGQTPFVGDNGNWWVGETDMGIFAGGVDVTGLRVGQSIAAASVDENGRPTSWRVYAPPAAQPELLLDMVVEEPVRYVFVNTDMDGNPLEARALFIRIYMPALGTDENGENLTTGYFYTDLNPYFAEDGAYRFTSSFGHAQGYVGTHNAAIESWWQFEISKDNRCIYNYGYYRNNMFNAPAEIRKYGPNDAPVANSVLNGVLTSVGLRPQYASIPAGTEIKIFKVK